MDLTEEEFNHAKNATIFRGLEPSEFELVLKSAQLKEKEDGEFFFMEEDTADRAFILVEGKVKLIQITTDGQQVILGYLGPGRVFGIIAILKMVTYPVTAQAVGECRSLVWDQTDLNFLMDQYPRMALNALRIMSGQIRDFQKSIRDLSTKRVEQRIARTIVRLSRQSGRKTDEGVLIDLPLSRQDLAEMTGTTLYTVSRILKEWENQNLIKSQRRRVVITYPHGLVSIAEDLPDKEDIEENTGDLNKCDLKFTPGINK